MSAGPGSALGGPRAGSVQIAGSAVVVGTARLGEGSILAEGAVIRSEDTGVEVGTGSAVLENSVIVGNAVIPTVIGRRSVFGHLCTVIGAVAGDLCEIGNASILMPGARLGDRVLLGEGTLVPAGTTLPSDVVAVGRPARIIRSVSADGLRRLAALRDGDLSVPPRTAITVEQTQEPAPRRAHSHCRADPGHAGDPARHTHHHDLSDDRNIDSQMTLGEPRQRR